MVNKTFVNLCTYCFLAVLIICGSFFISAAIHEFVHFYQFKDHARGLAVGFAIIDGDFKFGVVDFFEDYGIDAKTRDAAEHEAYFVQHVSFILFSILGLVAITVHDHVGVKS